MFSLRKKIFILIGVCFAFLAGVTYLVIIPTIHDIQRVNTAIQKDKADLEIKLQQGQLMKNLLIDYKAAQTERAILATILIEEGKELQFVTDLEKIALQYNFESEPRLSRIAEAKKDKAATDTIIAPLPLKIEMSGSYLETMRYLANIESLPYYFNIKEISIVTTRENQGETGSQLNGTIFIKDPLP